MSLHYHASGEPHAPALVFLHGLGVSSWMWMEQIETLQSEFYCLAIDLPGSGESYRETWHSFADTADQVADIIATQAADGKAHVVGLSLGGYAALHLLRRHPERLKSVVVSGVSTTPLPNAWLWRLSIPPLSHLAKMNWMVSLNMRLMQLPEEAHTVYRRDMARLSPQTFKRVYDEVIPFQIADLLQPTEVPLLAVAGSKEVKTVVAGLDEFLKAVPTAVTARMPGAHHGWNAEFPDIFTRMITAWVQRDPLPEELEIEVPSDGFLVPSSE